MEAIREAAGDREAEGPMERQKLKELHYITPVDNVASIMREGILSHARVSGLVHGSVAMQEVQDRRATVVVPNGRRLHEYVNLYICARNPMLYKLHGQSRTICVLSVSTDVLDLPSVVVADSNASSKYVRFAAAPAGLRIVDDELTFAEYWTIDDQLVGWRRKAAKCAEVLVPERVDPRHIGRAYVCCEETKQTVEALCSGLEVSVDRHLFFA